MCPHGSTPDDWQETDPMTNETAHDYLKLNEGEKHVEHHGNTWVACASCGVLMRNQWGMATWVHGEDCPYRYIPKLERS